MVVFKRAWINMIRTYFDHDTYEYSYSGWLLVFAEGANQDETNHSVLA